RRRRSSGLGRTRQRFTILAGREEALLPATSSNDEQRVLHQRRELRRGRAAAARPRDGTIGGRRFRNERQCVLAGRGWQPHRVRPPGRGWVAALDRLARPTLAAAPVTAETGGAASLC